MPPWCYTGGVVVGIPEIDKEAKLSVAVVGSTISADVVTSSALEGKSEGHLALDPEWVNQIENIHIEALKE